MLTGRGAILHEGAGDRGVGSRSFIGATFAVGPTTSHQK